MSEIFVSYARSTAAQAKAVAEALRALGLGVWIDDALPAHRSYTDVIEERLREAKAVLVIWSADAARSNWVRAEANTALEAGKLVQLSIDGVMPPMPFNQIHCADLAGWNGDPAAAGWRKVVSSIAELIGGGAIAASAVDAAPLALPAKPSIAVLPFASLTGDGDQDYFADGMVEEIVTALSRIRALFVIASGSSFSFKAKATSPQEAARSLGVRYVLTGSVRKAAGRVRISASLMDATVGGQIWADRFEGSLADVFALQDTVALSVAGVIEPAVQAAEIERVSLRPTSNMNSYDLYLRALPFYRKFTSADMVKALEFLDRAIALDADFGLALAFAARCHGQIFVYGWSDDPESHRRQGLDLVHRALKVAGDDPQVLIHLARPVMNLERDLEAATALIDRATAINPGSSEGWLMSGLVRLVSGEPDLAAEHLQTSIRLDPLSASRPRQLGGMGVARFEQERFSEAIPFFKEWAQRSDMPTSFAYLAACYGHLGQMDPGREALARYRALSKATIEELAGYQFARAEHRKLLMEGVARVERNTLTPAPADT